jgi:hypothetical protein
MGISIGISNQLDEQLTLLSPDGQAPLFITVERQYERIDGGALVAMLAHCPDPHCPTVRWDNPFKPAVQGHGRQWHDDEIGVAGCIMSLVNAIRNGTDPSYGALQARLDQEITLAIRKSARGNGQPVHLPLQVSEADTL